MSMLFLLLKCRPGKFELKEAAVVVEGEEVAVVDLIRDLRGSDLLEIKETIGLKTAGEYKELVGHRREEAITMIIVVTIKANKRETTTKTIEEVITTKEVEEATTIKEVEEAIVTRVIEAKTTVETITKETEEIAYKIKGATKTTWVVMAEVRGVNRITIVEDSTTGVKLWKLYIYLFKCSLTLKLGLFI